MSFAARTLVEALPGPATITDERGRVLVANDGWRQAAAEGGPYAVEDATLADADGDCPAHARLLSAVRGMTRAAGPSEMTCSCGGPAGLIRIARLESSCGAARYLITVRPGVDAPAAADAAVGAKQQFLALLGHEVRTPVTTVTATIDLLRAQQLPSDVRDTVDTLHRAVYGLRSLTDDLLDLARLETATLQPNYGPVMLREVLESVLEPLQHHTRNQGILLLAAPAPDLPETVEGDADRLRQVLSAVVGNAVKYTERGEVVVTADHDGDGWYAIVVSDTGPGIGADDQARIFAPFTQADSSATRRHEGAGLGLTLAARLTERMGGTVTVRSEPGQGSSFTIRLPLRPLSPVPVIAAPAPAGRQRIAVCAPSPRAQLVLSWMLTAAGAAPVPVGWAELMQGGHRIDTVLWCDDAHDPRAVERAEALDAALGFGGRALMVSSTDPRTGVVRRPGLLTAPLTLDRLTAGLNQKRTGVRGAPVTVPPLPGGRVLLAEDNSVNRTVFRRMIELMGVECVAVGDGAAAVSALLDGGRFDVALMDVQMPEVDGLEATRRVRAAASDVPILALTATALQDDRERCLAAGMNGYLSKPITLPELRAALAPYLEAPAEPGAGEPAIVVLDRNKLHELEEQLDGRELVALTVGTFLSELGGRRQALQAALQSRQYDRIRAVAHTLKSSSGLLGAGPLAEACATVERLGSGTADAAALAAAVDDVLRLAGATAEAMNGYLTDGEPAVRP